MIKNYFKTAYRILFRNKVYSLINIFGLSVALTSVLVIFLFISHELTFDKHLSNFDSIYKVVKKEATDNGERFEEATPVPLSRALKAELTGHNDITQVFFNSEQLLRVNNDKYNEEGLLYADTNFVKVFDVEFISGNPSQLKEPNIIYLTKELAIKYFGSIENALNKEIIMMDSVSLNVAGVIKNTPHSTHLPYKAIISWSSLTKEYFNFEYDNWGTIISGFACYLTLKENTPVQKVTNQIQDIFDKNDSDKKNRKKDYFILQPLQKIHLDDRFDPVSGAYVTSKKFIWIFISVGLFILIIAFINFTNLSIVQTIKRAKEIGIRKVLGANRKMLVKQFLGETFLLLFIAEIISLIFAEIILGKINEILGNDINLQVYGNFSIIFFLVLVLLSLTFLSGFYPAIILSKYNPVKALRKNLKIGRKKSFSIYNLLVVFQFFISQVLIVSAIIISLQINYFKKKDLGFAKENIILLDLPQNQSQKANTLADLILQNPQISNVSLGIGPPLSGSNINSSFHLFNGEKDNYHANIKTVDTSYYSLYNLKLVAGSWYKKTNYNDSIFNVVVNQSLIKKLEIEDPMNAIDLRLFGSIRARITGVVEDFHVYPLHYEIPPVIFLPLDDYYFQLHVKTNGRSYSEIKSFLEESWNTIFPEYIFQHSILSDRIEEEYESEQRIFNIVSIFTFIAIIIACLGLYGLVSFILVQKTKEVSIRKALGASISSLIILISKQFLKLVFISCILAWPVAYYLLNKWLNDYAYRIELHLWTFVLSGIILIVITFLTIFFQALKVSNTNPVDTLKYE